MNVSMLFATEALGAEFFDAWSLVIWDSAIKGLALLVIAGLASMLLWRDSAAMRYFAWLLALSALIAAPLLSAALPQWRILPSWTRMALATEAAAPVAPERSRAAEEGVTQAAEVGPDVAGAASDLPIVARSGAVEESRSASHLDRPSVIETPAVDLKATIAPRQWLWVLPVAWLAGCFVLLVRLAVARWLLWRAEQRSVVVGLIDPAATERDEPLIVALRSAAKQLGIKRSITLLLQHEKSIPIVWGLFRIRLMLPANARGWNRDQLQSVLLHELAHIRRGDPLGQMVVQIACAMHWLNPLVWMAAWRIGVERERACDDLVISSGVKPSAYAGHLLDVVTGGAPSRWINCGSLAMARRSSLESRLVAVLSDRQNRRRVSAALSAIALLITISVAIPLAMLHAADETPATPPPSQKPVEKTKLDAGLEKKLQWGETVHGLRAAIVIRPIAGAARDAAPDMQLAIQNVSDAAIRITDIDTPPTVNLRKLYIKIEGKIMMGLGAREPALGDVTLAPREVVYLNMFLPVTKGQEDRAIGPSIAADAQKDTRYRLKIALEIEKAPNGAWKGKLETGEASAAQAMGEAQPKDEHAQALLTEWRKHARTNGDIPGGLVGRLSEKVREFIDNNTGDPAGDPYAKKMAPLAPKVDGDRDWKQEELIALLDEIAEVSSIPLETTLEALEAQTLNLGKTLPKVLEDAPWGETQANGLRMAWLLEPKAGEYRLNSPLRSRILLHNAGKNVVVFRTRTWHQSSAHKAIDAIGEEIKIDSTFWTTRGQLMPYRLGPGEYVELNAAGIGVGANKDSEDWQGTQVGAWIVATSGDEVTFVPDVVPLHDWNETILPGVEPVWWGNFVATRLKFALPLPLAAEERVKILRDVTRDLFGADPSPTEIATFVSDPSPDPLEALQSRLLARPGVSAFAGNVESGSTKFKVLPVDPDAAKKPRMAKNPGRYTLAENVRLVVSRRPDGERIVNEANIQFFSPDPTKEPPGEPHEVKLPDGYDSWAAAWVRGSNVLWVMQASELRSYDFTDPARVVETVIKDHASAPAPIVEVLRKESGASAAPAADEAKKLPDDALWKTKTPFGKIPVTITNWSEGKQGLRLGLLTKAEEGWRLGKSVKVELWLHNTSNKDISLVANPGRPDVGLTVAAKDSQGQDHWAASGNISIIAIPLHCVLPAGHVARVKDFELSFDERGNEEKAWTAPRFRELPTGKYQLRCVWSDADRLVSQPGEWVGELSTGPIDFTLSE
jgi:beta-lactamase regulating signal transducer with metallopeptidase domain